MTKAGIKKTIRYIYLTKLMILNIKDKRQK